MLNVSIVQLGAKSREIAKNKNRTFTICSNVTGS
jgi:hypothetical protein